MSEKPYSSKYANSHRVMLESLPTKALQRLYRLLDAKSAAHSLQVSYLKSFDNLQAIDHKVINRHNRQRATCDTQCWGVEEVLNRRARLEAEALNPRPDPKERVQVQIDEINQKIAHFQNQNDLIRDIDYLSNEQKQNYIISNIASIGRLYDERDRLSRWLF